MGSMNSLSQRQGQTAAPCTLWAPQPFDMPRQLRGRPSRRMRKQCIQDGAAAGRRRAWCRAAATDSVGGRVMHKEPASTSLPDLDKWAADAGIQWPKLRPADFAGLRGMAAREDVAAGEVLVSLPVAAALVVSPRERCPLPGDFCDAAFYRKAPWHVQLALKLLHERRLGPASRLAPYVAALPRAYSTPLAWGEGELAALQYPHLQQQVRLQKEAMEKLMAGLRASTPRTPVTEEDMGWALQAVRSRAFSGPYAGPQWKSRAKTIGAVGLLAGASVVFAHVPAEQVLNGAIAAALFNLLYDVVLSQKVKWYALCCVIDFMNHSSRVKSDVEYEYFADRFSVRCQTSFAKGEQVFISYGTHGNDSLLQYFGFVERDNPHDAYTIPDISQSDPAAASACGLPEGQKAQWQQVVLTKKGPNDDTVKRLTECGLTKGKMNQLVRRICEAEQQVITREPRVDCDLARAFRREKLKLLQAALAANRSG